MAWIKIEHTTPDKPEVAAVAESLNIDHDAVFGKCVRLWIWADQQSADGYAPGVTPSFIDRLTNCPGFARALLEVGWLKARNNSLLIPNFDRHNGQTAKTRALTASRMKRSRYAPSVTNASPEKEKERELDTSASADVPHTPKRRVFCTKSQAEAIYSLYPRREGKDKAIDAIRRAVKKLAESHDDPLAWLQERVLAFAQSPRGKDSDRDLIPHPATWFNQGRYGDDDSTWQIAQRRDRNTPPQSSNEIFTRALANER